ncbi:MAG: ATP-binding protein [Candidatus Pacebacteria bacterium]|nr:ATP-binding protein [Candidatus Paceibacterota bacterium]
MKEFSHAKIRLTVWYTLGLMLVSIFLSGIYYQRTISMLEVQYRQIELRLNDNKFPAQPMRNLSQRLELLADDFILIKSFLVRQLLMINGLVLILGVTSSYFLAGITLMPIKKSLEKQKQFIGDAAHELKTPLTALKTSLEVGLMDKQTKSAKKLLESSLNDVNSLTALTENLLSLAKLESADFKLNFEQVKLEQVINRVVNHLKPLAKKKKISLKTSCLAGLSLVANENALVEAVMILVDNAIKYSGEKTEIKIIAKKEKNKLVLKITDQGIGIDQKHLDKIFDRFYRVDDSRTKNFRAGYGLGLALAKKIVTQHSGIIKVESKLNQGSTFTIIF